MSNQLKYSNVPPALSGDEACKMLEHLKFFSGVSFHGMNGPYTSSRQVVEVRKDVFNSVRVSQAISNEDFYPANERDARNAHVGWPSLGALPGRPWDILNQDTKGTISGNWVSRRMVVHRYTVSLRVEDLKPCDAFVKEVEEALSQPTYVECIQALRRTCAVWGEMIPLDAVIGASLAATGTLAPNQSLTGDAATFRPGDRGPDVMQMIDRSLDITGTFEKRFEARIQGGYPEIFSKSGFDAWLSNAVNIDNSSTWEVVKVNRAVPITDLLPKSLRQKVARMCTCVLTRPLSVGNPVPLNFDGGVQGVKDIKQVNVWHNFSTIQDLSIVYVDGTVSGPYQFGKGKEPTDTFVLARGEYITECFVWTSGADVTAIQFAKNTGQVSNISGPAIANWNPYVLNAGGDALLGLSGTFANNSITQVQPVWRGDVRDEGHRRTAVTHTGFYSIAYGSTFNDYGFLGDASTARISQIKYRAATNNYIAQFQMTYTSDRCGDAVDQETPIRGSDAGLQETWTLAKDEYIKKCRVRRNATGILLLEFTTNKGTVQKMGWDTGDQIMMEPPHKDMVLYYIMGRSYGVMQWMSFVWGMPPAEN